MYSLTLRPCTAGILASILDPDVPFVWIRRHTPKRQIEWWSTPVRLSAFGGLHEVEVRGMELDLQMPTPRFLELLPEFEDHGLALFQMTRRVPGTLTLDGIADETAERILVQNGLHLRFYLPHAFERALVSSPNREVLAAVARHPELARWVEGPLAEAGSSGSSGSSGSTRSVQEA